MTYALATGRRHPRGTRFGNGVGSQTGDPRVWVVCEGSSPNCLRYKAANRLR
jgi:hypothetical protein